MDDTQLVITSYNKSGVFSNEETARRRIKQVFCLISKFMNENHLKVKPKRPQFIPFPRMTKSADFDPIALPDHCVDSPLI